MIILESTSEFLEVVTTTAQAIDVVISYADDNGSDLIAWSQETAITTATTTTVLSAPAASTQRQVKMITWENKGTAAQSITLIKDVSWTKYVIRTATILPWQNATFTQMNWWVKYSASGQIEMLSATDKVTPIAARSFGILKVWATTEAAWVMHFMGLVSWSPWAWSPWTPWLNGRATDGTAAWDAWCIPIKNPSTGANWLTSYVPTCTTASTQYLLDVLWVNTWLVVTTTTAQAITPAALPARDAAWTTNGNDVLAWILVTTATTNAGAVTNMTISYTDQDWNAWATWTMASFPATAVAWTLVPFQLAAWDTWVRSVQSVTLGTSLVTWAVSLVLYRMIAWVPVLIANAWGKLEAQQSVNVRLYNGACLLPAYIPTATTASNIFATLNVEEK